MNEIQCTQHLINILAGCDIAKAATLCFQFFKHRMLQILEDEEKPFFPAKHFDHVNEILMTQFLKRNDKIEQNYNVFCADQLCYIPRVNISLLTLGYNMNCILQYA